MEFILTFYSETENGDAVFFNTQTGEEIAIVNEVIADSLSE